MGSDLPRHRGRVFVRVDWIRGRVYWKRTGELFERCADVTTVRGYALERYAGKRTVWNWLWECLTQCKLAEAGVDVQVWEESKAT